MFWGMLSSSWPKCVAQLLLSGLFVAHSSVAQFGCRPDDRTPGYCDHFVMMHVCMLMGVWACMLANKTKNPGQNDIKLGTVFLDAMSLDSKGQGSERNRVIISFRSLSHQLPPIKYNWLLRFTKIMLIILNWRKCRNVQWTEPTPEGWKAE